ncbi:putative tetratricopeptide-like helical domain superfamily [Plasmopara halstedii]
MIKLLFQTVWSTSQTPQFEINGVTVMTKLCVLLAICWLSYDQVGNAGKSEKLLYLCCDLCQAQKSTKHLAKWPQFLLGMVKMVEFSDDLGAIECFRCAVTWCRGLNPNDGFFYYWYAVSLMRTGLLSDAADELDKCIRLAYEPAACLSLQALLYLQLKDLHTVSKILQRGMEIDYTQPTSIFNYGLLLVRMGNLETQQTLFGHILEHYSSKIYRQMEDMGSTDLGATKASDTLFSQRTLTNLLPSRSKSVSASMVHRHMAVAAMENGCWLESKQHFEIYFGSGDNIFAFEASRDFVYVLLQCRLPSLALCKCEQYLTKYDLDDNLEVSHLILHLYKADALLCLERVAECCEYLQLVVQPKLQRLLAQNNVAADVNSSMREEFVSCHTQFINNLAVVMACCVGVDPAISILREGLQLYRDCFAMTFNLVLLLLRKKDMSNACAVWAKARGWSLRSENCEVTESISLTNIISVQTAATSYPSISEHVEGKLDGKGGVSAQQLVYLDALILNYWRKSWKSQLVDNSLRHIESLTNQTL